MPLPPSKDPTDTPAMRQFHRFKQLHPDCILLFRMGDFYEMFFDDAKLAHKVLGVTLTQRTAGVPMAGVPYHAVESYLRRLIRAGHRVAVCDQVEDAAQAKGVVKRDVTRVLTPGTLTDAHLLEEGRENPLAAVMFLGTGSGHRAPGSADAGVKSPVSADPGTRNPGPAAPASPVALAWAELSTGAFHVALMDAAVVGDELARIAPRELLYCESADGAVPPRVQALLDATQAAPAARPAWQFRLSEAVELLRKHFGVASLAGWGFDDDEPAVELAPAGAVLHYLLETQCAAASDLPSPPGRGAGGEGVTGRPAPTTSSTSPHPAAQQAAARARARLAHLQPPRRFERHAHMVIDQTSLRSLEIERTLRSGQAGGDGTLIGVFGGPEVGCVTSMGKRLLRQWLCYPLLDRAAIESRQRAVAELVEDVALRDALRTTLDAVQDVPRIVARLGVGRATPRDLVALGCSSAKAGELVELLRERPLVKGYHDALAAAAGPLHQLATLVAGACVDEPPAHLREGGLFRDGHDAHLDELRLLQRDSHSWLANYQKQLIELTGIPSLKVGFNKVFGYYIELTAAQRAKIDEVRDARFRDWTRKQTLKNAERFITADLKEFEGKVLSAESRAVARENELFLALCDAAVAQVAHLHAFADAAAALDVLTCFANKAARRRWTRPALDDAPVLHITAGRHPVLEDLLGDRFVANDVELGASGSEARVPGSAEDAPANTGSAEPETRSPEPAPSAHSLALITGPNMAGKSTYIRQAALITLLAHCGCFVPAEAATVGLTDRIFTRIGASDELHAGASTFMVEMTETANICHHATDRSLVILDEIGRGTSTLDGLSLAWAIAEHLSRRRCRTLFATHYHEITALADDQPNVTNLNVAVREWDDQVVFLHRIERGRTDRSYGIHVAKIAGLPAPVIARAHDLLAALSVSHDTGPRLRPPPADAAAPRPAQLSLFTEYLPHPALTELLGLDLTRLSPLDAFDTLRQLQRKAREGA